MNDIVLDKQDSTWLSGALPVYLLGRSVRSLNPYSAEDGRNVY